MPSKSWTDIEIKRLEDLWKKSSDKEDFKKLVATDSLLNKRTWHACDIKGRTLGLYKAGEIVSGRIVFEKMKEKDIEDLKKLLPDPSVAWADIKADSRFKDLSQKQLRNWAASKSISVKKNSKITVPKSHPFDERLREIVIEGRILTSKKSEDEAINSLLKMIKEEFPEAARNLTKKYLNTQVENIIWNKKTLDALHKVVGFGLPMEKFSKHHDFIPVKYINRKYKLMTAAGGGAAKQSVSFLKGLGRIGDLEGLDGSFQFPDSSSKEPYVVEGINKCKQVLVVNGANIGLNYDRVMEVNPVRKTLLDADAAGDDLVVISNPFDIDTKKASGGLKVQRAFASGLNTNLKLLDPKYVKRLQEEKYRSKDEKRDNPTIVYETIAEKFMNTITGWEKVSKNTKCKKIIQLGYKEEEVIANGAAWELGYHTARKQAQIQAELDAAISGGDEEAIAELTELKSRHIKSNITPEELVAYCRKVINYVVNKLEEAIPNSKVVGKGSIFVKAGEETIAFVIPGHLRVGDNLLHEYNRTFGAYARMNLIAPTTVICHPYALNYRTTSREISVNNKREEARVFVAPIVVDGEFMLKALKDSIRSAHPIFRVVRNVNFKPGVLRLRFMNGVANPEPLPLPYLVKRSKKSKKSDPFSGIKYHWIHVITDSHYGSRSRSEVCTKAGKFLGVGDASIQMLREGKAFNRIHMYTHNDDISHGNHFDTHKQPHPRQMSYQQMEEYANKLDSKEAVQLLLSQHRLKGVDWLEEQIQQVKERHLKANVDYFGSIVSNIVRSKTKIIGIDEIHGVRFDARSLGAINFGTGNHNEKTVDRWRVENLEYRDYLRALLYAEKEFKNKRELVDRLVAAPLEGNKYFAWGYLQGPGSDCQWAIEFRSDPPRLSSWMDPLKAAVNNDASRGDYGLYMTGHPTIKVYGDKHFNASVDTCHTFYHLCAAGTSTDLYGHRGFPPNNTGISFIGLPIDGPEAGPILVRNMHIAQISKYFDDPYEIDWEETLPKAV